MLEYLFSSAASPWGEESPNSELEQSIWQDHLAGALVSYILNLTVMYASSFALYAHAQRYFANKHIVSLLAFIGTIVNIVRVFLILVVEVFENTFWEVCSRRVVFGLTLIGTSVSMMFMFYHLLFKARLVNVYTHKYEWTWLQLLTAGAILVLPVIQIAQHALSRSRFDLLPSRVSIRTLAPHRCRYNVYLDIAYVSIAFKVVNNVLASSLFLNGLVQALVIAVGRMSFMQTVSATLNIILFGEKGLRTAQAQITEVRRTPTVVSRSQVALVMLVRRSFIAMLLNCFVTVGSFLMTLHWFSTGSIPRPVLPLSAPLSWIFTVFASPLPGEHRQDSFSNIQLSTIRSSALNIPPGPATVPSVAMSSTPIVSTTKSPEQAASVRIRGNCSIGVDPFQNSDQITSVPRTPPPTFRFIPTRSAPSQNP